MPDESFRNKFVELRLRNFRAFDNARLPLGELTAVLGRNGAGKTTLMEAIEFLRDCLEDSLLNALERRGGLRSIRRRQRARRPYDVSVAMQLQLEDTPIVYGFRIGGPSSNGDDSVVSVKEEYLLSTNPAVPEFRRLGQEIHIDANTAKPALASQSLILPTIAEQDKFYFQTWRSLCSMRTYNPSPASVREEWEIGDKRWLTRDGRNTADILKELQGDPTDRNWLIEHLDRITPGITDVRAETTSTGRRFIMFEQLGESEVVKHKYSASMMSDGTNRALAILVALRQKPPAELLFIDEIESSVHPAALGVLLDAIGSSLRRSQVIISSHSPEALAHPLITGDRVRVLDWQEGVSKLFCLNKEVQEALVPPENVGRLLRSNALWTEDMPLVNDPEAFFHVSKPD